MTTDSRALELGREDRVMTIVARVLVGVGVGVLVAAIGVVMMALRPFQSTAVLACLFAGALFLATRLPWSDWKRSALVGGAVGILAVQLFYWISVLVHLEP